MMRSTPGQSQGEPTQMQNRMYRMRTMENLIHVFRGLFFSISLFIVLLLILYNTKPLLLCRKSSKERVYTQNHCVKGSYKLYQRYINICNLFWMLLIVIRVEAKRLPKSVLGSLSMYSISFIRRVGLSVVLTSLLCFSLFCLRSGMLSAKQQRVY